MNRVDENVDFKVIEVVGSDIIVLTRTWISTGWTWSVRMDVIGSHIIMLVRTWISILTKND